MKRILYLLSLLMLLVSCGTVTQSITRGEQYAKMYEEKPVTLLVMPPINNTSNVEAKDLLYTSISRPLAEAGYYVISPLLAMDVLKAESAYDSELFVNVPLTTLGTISVAMQSYSPRLTTGRKAALQSMPTYATSSNRPQQGRFSLTEVAI